MNANKIPIQQLPNAVTAVRVVVCIIGFWVIGRPMFIWLYILAGASDVLDGFLARRLNAASVAGARLDSAADLLLAALSVTYLACRTTLFDSAWIWWTLGIIAAVRVANLVAVRCRFGLWGSTHTILNKVVGVMLFCLVPLEWFGGASLPEWVPAAIAATAFATAIEESAIILTGKGFDPDRKSLFTSKRFLDRCILHYICRLRKTKI